MLCCEHKTILFISFFVRSALCNLLFIQKFLSVFPFAALIPPTIGALPENVWARQDAFWHQLSTIVFYPCHFSKIQASTGQQRKARSSRSTSNWCCVY